MATFDPTFAPNRFLVDQHGNAHLNGATFYDTAETALAATFAQLNGLAGAAAGDGSANLTLAKLLRSTPQIINVTGATAITSSVVTCQGTTTAPTLPNVALCGIVFVKNLGSGNCTIAADAVSDVIATGSGTGASSLVLASNSQAILVSDGTNWNRMA